MSNDIAILITGHCADTEVDKFLSTIDLTFEKQNLDEINKGNKHSYFDIWTFSNHCIDKEKVLKFIEQFKNYKFDNYSYVTMTISCDNNEDLEGIYIHPSVEKDEIHLLR